MHVLAVLVMAVVLSPFQVQADTVAAEPVAVVTASGAAGVLA